MATQTKQEVSVQTKPQEAEKAAANLWLRPYEEFERFFDRVLGRDLLKNPKGREKPATNAWLRPYEEFERLFERMLSRNPLKPLTWDMPAWREFMAAPDARLPSVDIIDRDDHVLVRAEIPGVGKDDLNVSISDNVLIIKGDTRREEKKENGDYFRHEISRTSFARSVTLPDGIDASKVSAALTDGVLEVTVGKAETAKRRSVKVE
jgi:HSP20 family protein